jgi:hypothetical protein
MLRSPPAENVPAGQAKLETWVSGLSKVEINPGYPGFIVDLAQSGT